MQVRNQSHAPEKGWLNNKHLIPLWAGRYTRCSGIRVVKGGNQESLKDCCTLLCGTGSADSLQLHTSGGNTHANVGANAGQWPGSGSKNGRACERYPAAPVWYARGGGRIGGTSGF